MTEPNQLGRGMRACLKQSGREASRAYPSQFAGLQWTVVEVLRFFIFNFLFIIIIFLHKYCNCIVSCTRCMEMNTIDYLTFRKGILL